MIIASAIKFHITKTNEDVILCGYRHSDIFKQLKQLGFMPHQGYKELEQGFIDNKNQFLNRTDAFRHAKACKQIISDKTSGELYSEDLY